MKAKTWFDPIRKLPLAPKINIYAKVATISCSFTPSVVICVMTLASQTGGLDETRQKRVRNESQ